MFHTVRKVNAGDRAYIVLCYVFIVFVCILTLYPFLYVIAASLSSSTSVMRDEVYLLPKELTFRAYQVVVQYKGIWVAYANTVFYTAAGSVLSLILTALAAYPLSKQSWGGRKFFSVFVAFTMWFSGGMIPFYLVFRYLNLLNTRAAIILYPAIAAFYVIIMRSYFEGIPEEIEEAAKLDGAQELQILFKIILPLSKPVLACVGLYYAVGRWNSYFWEMTFLSDQSKLPVQVVLQRIILAGNLGQDIERALSRGEASVPITIQYACIMVTALPIIMLYPFVQKYFVKGVMIGGVKG